MDNIRDLFSSIAPKYDLLNTALSLGIDRQWRRQAVQFLKGSRNVLDLCAGTLAVSREIFRINSNATVTAVDFSQEMLEWGLKRLPSQFRSRIRIQCSDFYKFVSPPGSFDGVICAYGMRNLVDNPAALQRIHQLLRPSGLFVVLEFFRPDRWYTWLWHLTYAQCVMPMIGRIVSRRRDAYKHLRDSVRGFYTLDRYAELLRENRFGVKVAKRLTGGISGLIVAEKPSPPK